MDLIGQLINQKEHNKDINVQLYLEELIKYEKLSRSPKFKHIEESTILQKQLPLCWKAFNDDAFSVWMLYNCQFIINALNTNLLIFDDLFDKYKDKKLKQKLIIGNTNDIEFVFSDLTDLALNFENDNYDDSNYIQLRQKNYDGYSYVVIKQDDNKIFIYQGFVENNDDIDSNNNYSYFAYKNYTKKEKDIYIKLKAFSPQGNNNYNFAAIKDNNNLINVSMINDATFSFKNIDNVELYKINLTKSDENMLNVNVNDIDFITDIIVKYYLLGKGKEKKYGVG